MTDALISLDTNILIYSIDDNAGVKRYQAMELIERSVHQQNGVLTMQVLCEFYFAVTRKGKMPANEARDQVSDWQVLFPTILPSAQSLESALKVVKELNIQFWDAVIWAVARENGVRTLYSEDFQHNRVLEGVRFVNPFLEVAGVAEDVARYS